MTVTKQGRVDKGDGRSFVPGFRRLAVLALALAVIPVPLGAQDPPPDARWYTFDTAHFQVVFHEGLDEVARDAARSAERALERLDAFGTRPDEPIRLLVTDHMDLSNGFASSIPYPRIIVWARPPMGGLGPIPFDDWMEVLVTHEVAHVLHGEMTGTLGRAGRLIFGRAPLLWPLFTAFTLPSWAIEGVAVQAESALTGTGRLHGTRLEGVARAAALEGSLERADQVIGVTGVFPGGERPYVYGGLFWEYLADRFGVEVVGTWVRRQAERLNPYRLDATAREVFGRSLGELHREWQESVRSEAEAREARVRARALASAPTLLTRDARFARHARFDPGTGAMVYVRSDGWSETGLVRWPAGCLPVLAGSRLIGGRGGGGTGEAVEGREPPCPEERIRALYQASSPAPAPDGGWWIVQPDFVDRYRIRGDLWHVDAEGERTVLTRGARMAEMDARRSDGAIVAVIEGAGAHRLVLLEPDGSETAELAGASRDRLWSHPRWSPDGEMIAVARWRSGGIREVVVLGADGSERAVIDRGRAPVTGPVWSPDGGWLVWSSERSGVSNLYTASVGLGSSGELRAGPVRQISDLVTGAALPEVAPEGDRVVFSILRASGWELAMLPFRPEEAFDPLPADARFRLAEGETGSGGADGTRPDRWIEEQRDRQSTDRSVDEERARQPTDRSADEEDVGGPRPRPWSPLSTLRPRYVLPFVGGAQFLRNGRGESVRVLPTVIGVSSAATDLVGRHRWEAGLGGPVGDGVRRWEGYARWRWAGLGNPVLTGSIEQGFETLGRVRVLREGDPVEDARELLVVARERAAGLQVEIADPGIRRSRSVGIELRGIRQDRAFLTPDGTLTREGLLPRVRRELIEGSIILGWNAVRSVPLAAGPHEGVSFVTRLRARREANLPTGAAGVPGRDAALQDVVGLARLFQPLPIGSGWGESGSVPVLALRLAGGAASGPGAGSGHFSVGGSGAGVLSVRGLERGVLGGARAWAAGAELRVPLARLHRGLGVLPLHLDQLAGSMFVDVGGVDRVGSGVASAARSGSGSAHMSRFATVASIGAELALRQTILFHGTERFRVGIAVPVAGGSGVAVHAGLGWSF